MIRSILAVVAGYASWTVVWLAGGLALLVALSINPAEEGALDNAVYRGLSLVLSVICSLCGGFVCGRVAGAPRSVAVWVLASLLLLTGLGVQIGAWSTMPVWYHVPFLLLLVPVTLAGSRFAPAKP